MPSTAPGSFVDTANLARVDPYLAWAEASSFQSFTRGSSAPTEVPVIVELSEGRTPADLAAALGRGGSVSAAYMALNTRYCTASFSAEACERLVRPDNGLVQRFEFTMPVLPQRLAPVPTAPPVAPAGPPISSTTSTLIVVIDDGCPFAHANFRRGTTSRLLSIWDQDPQPAFGVEPAAGRRPTGFDYGREVDRHMIEALLAQSAVGSTIDEDVCYETARYSQLRRRATHGAHVLDQLIGPRRLADRLALSGDDVPSWKTSHRQRSAGRRASAADTADVVFVQLPRDAWADPSGNALASCVLDGLRYAVGCAGAATKKIIVNISCAIYTGPHNGTSVFERALQDMVKQPRAQGVRQPRLRIFMPTGNSFGASWRAGAMLAANATASVRLRIPPSSEAPTFVQVWSAASSDAPVIAVRAPGPDGGRSPPIRSGEAQSLLKNGAVVAGAIHTLSDCRGTAATTTIASRKFTHSSLFLLAVDPTRTVERPGCNAPYGDWTIEITAAQQTEVHVYVARNESEMGAPLRGRAARLVDSAYDAERYLRESEDDQSGALSDIEAGMPESLIPIRRRGTISGVATGPGTQAVGGMCMGPQKKPSSYSSAGAPDPHFTAVCDESRSLPGIRGAGTRSGAVVRLQGTSFACPQRARASADGLVFAASTDRPFSDPPRSGRWGKEDKFTP